MGPEKRKDPIGGRIALMTTQECCSPLANTIAMFNEGASPGGPPHGPPFPNPGPDPRLPEPPRKPEDPQPIEEPDVIPPEVPTPIGDPPPGFPTPFGPGRRNPGVGAFVRAETNHFHQCNDR